MTFRCRLRSALILASMAAALPCSGQGIQLAPAGDADASDRSGDDPPSVYVGDSFEAQTAFRQADRLAEGKRWREAVRAYDRAAERFADKLVRIGPGAFLGAVPYANRQVAAWPDEGLKVYRLLHDEAADRALADARTALDLDALLSVMDAHFCTRQAATAGDLAAQLAAEAGEFDVARRVYERLLADHPDRRRLAAELEGKLALCLAWAGQTETARAKLVRIKTDNPNATLLWAGRQRNATDVIERAIADRVPPPDSDRTFLWPMLGGDLRGSRIAPAGIPPGAPLWEYGPKQGYDPTTAGQAKAVRRTSRSSVRQAYATYKLGICPVVADQTLYWCDRKTVWSVRLAGGLPAWPPYRAGQATDRSTRKGPVVQIAPFNLFTCTLHAGRLYVILDQPTGSIGSRQAREPKRDLPAEVTSGLLACLDVATGKPIWSRRLAEIDPSLAGVSLDAAPVWYRDKLFAVGRRRKRFGFEDCYLLRLDAATGRLDWQRHLASTSVSTYGRRRATFAFPAIGEATVYVCTNLGVMAAVNARDGLIRWVRVYHKDRTEEEAGSRFARHMRLWQYGPPICWRDALICRPLDSEFAVVVNRADGRIVRRIESSRLGHPQQILGVIDETLYTAGRELAAWDLTEDEPRWSRSLARYGGIMGRGQLTRSHVYLPTKNGLCRFALPDGTPALFDWPDDAVGGNVVVTPKLVVVAGDDRLTGYAPKDQAFARLQQRIDAAPSDPNPLVDLAEVAFRVGERRRAVAALERAVEVGGGFAQVTDPKIRARLFQNFIQFGDRAIDNQPPDYPLALEMYRQAAQCPPDTDAQVVYRLRLAEALTGMDRFDQAIEQHQQILADAGLRIRSIRPRPDGKAWPAGQLAERRIDAILSDHGRRPYERFERRAETMLALAVEGNDLAAMRRIVASFPNAHAARKALLAEGRVLEQRGEPRRAVRAYLQVLSRRAKDPEAPAILHRIAEAYLSADRPVAARRWLMRGAKAFPDHRFDQRGRQVGFAELARQLADRRKNPAPLPRFSLPVTKRWSRRFDDWVTVLQPRMGELPSTRWDIFVTHCDGKVEAFTASENRALWPSPVPCELRPALLGMTANRLVLVTQRQLLGVDVKAGKVAWSLSARPVEADGPGVDPESLRKWRSSTMTEDRIFGVLTDGHAVCLDADDGTVIWRGPLTDRFDTDVVANEEFFIYQAPVESEPRSVIHVLDSETGRPVRKIETKGVGRAFRLAMSEGGTLLAASSRRLSAFDPYTGEQIWQTAASVTNFRGTLLLGPDALYLSHNGRTLVRRSWETGEVLAESALLVGDQNSQPGGIVPTMRDGRLFAWTPQAVSALDARSMDLLWRGTTNADAVLTDCQVGPRYAVAVDRPTQILQDQQVQRCLAYFYDRREDSGVIPPGGAIDMGGYVHLRGIFFADHTILVVDGQTLHGWTGPGS